MKRKRTFAFYFIVLCVIKLVNAQKTYKLELSKNTEKKNFQNSIKECEKKGARLLIADNTKVTEALRKKLKNQFGKYLLLVLLQRGSRKLITHFDVKTGCS